MKTDNFMSADSHPSPFSEEASQRYLSGMSADSQSLLFSEDTLRRYLKGISGADRAAAEEAERYTKTLAAPPGSLGKLAEAAVQLAGITGQVKNRLDRRRIIVLCADNGVVAEGVSVAPSYVTLAQAVNMTKYRTGMSTLARHFGCEVEVVDVGINADLPVEKVQSTDAAFQVNPGVIREDEKNCTGCPAKTGPGTAPAVSCQGYELRYIGSARDILPRKIRRCTGNIFIEPAMTREEAVRAIGVGIERAEAAADEGIKVIGVGEMGIGNTTTSSAVLSVLTGLDVDVVTGRGGGLTDAAFLRKKEVISRALALHGPDPEDPLDVLSKVGGLDIAAMCGVYLGAARRRIPVVIDGFISIVAALCAVRLCPEVKDFLFPSHASTEPGYLRAAGELGLRPWLLLDMRLGEGSGCPLAFQILDAACALMNGMETFAEAQIDDGYLDEIRMDQGTVPITLSW